MIKVRKRDRQIHLEEAASRNEEEVAKNEESTTANTSTSGAETLVPALLMRKNTEAGTVFGGKEN